MMWIVVGFALLALIGAVMVFVLRKQQEKEALERKRQASKEKRSASAKAAAVKKRNAQVEQQAKTPLPPSVLGNGLQRGEANRQYIPPSDGGGNGVQHPHPLDLS